MPPKPTLTPHPLVPSLLIPRPFLPHMLLRHLPLSSIPAPLTTTPPSHLLLNVTTHIPLIPLHLINPPLIFFTFSPLHLWLLSPPLPSPRRSLRLKSAQPALIPLLPRFAGLGGRVLACWVWSRCLRPLTSDSLVAAAKGRAFLHLGGCRNGFGWRRFRRRWRGFYLGRFP